MKNLLALLLLASTAFVSCIQDDLIEDFVEPVLRLINTPSEIEINTEAQLTFNYFNNVGASASITPTWTSSNTDIITVSTEGKINAIAEGNATITISYKDDANDLTESRLITVVSTPVDEPTEPDSKDGSISTTSSYKLQGDFQINKGDGEIIITFNANYSASRALPGLFVYLSNNRNSTANALEIAAVEVFDGAHEYRIPNVGLEDFSHLLYFCKPFNVKVGDGKIN